MSIEIGAQLGQYRLEGKIGEGGMGVVWEATDTRLNRKVAIKFLPESVAGHGERLERFNREARVLASLNHAHIAGIHGLEEHQGRPFLVMELVPGHDLAQRLHQGPLPVNEALEAARQIADALEAAHESGVVHRDLKPANVQLGPDGTIKVLDFGLAKALDNEAAPDSASMSPTLTTPATLEGTILGTAAYMSPEQAKGKPVDRRADIWAFGVVLYEMLTGRRPFQGEGVSETLASVLMTDPAWETLPQQVPLRIGRLIRRCLDKDPRRRLRDIGEARFALEEALAGRGDGPEAAAGGDAAARAAGVPLWMAAAVAIGLALVAAAFVWWQSSDSAPPLPTRRFELAMETPYRNNSSGNPMAISPDGERVAYISEQRLWVRRLDRLEPEPIETVQDLQFVFWSPDSRWVGFAALGSLWKVPAEGGTPLIIVEEAGPFTGGSGASWGESDRIVIARGDPGLYEVSARGGDLKAILEADPEVHSDFHQPLVLPDGNLVFVPHRMNGRPDSLELLVDGQRRVLLELEGQDIWDPGFDASGHLIFRRQPVNAGVWALPFDLETHTVQGEPFLLVPNGDQPSVARDGTLIHTSSSASRETQLVWLNRQGEVEGVVGEPQQQFPFPSLSPDQRLVAVQVRERSRATAWIHDLERGTRMLAAEDMGTTSTGVTWSPDGRRLLYAADGFRLVSQSIDNLGQQEEFGTGYLPVYSPDGRFMTVATQKDGDWDLYYRQMESEGEWTKLLTAPGDQIAARVSPDGRFYAYMSDDGDGLSNVYVRSFPASEGLWQVSNAGGYWPRWSSAGDRIYYVREDTIYEVDVQDDADTGLRLSRPREVLERPSLGWTLIFNWPAGFDVSADGQRFLVSRSVVGEEQGGGIIVVQNWLAEVEGS